MEVSTLSRRSMARIVYPGMREERRCQHILRTHLKGSKYKLSHKNAKSGAWSIPKEKDEREREIFLLEGAKRRIESLPPITTTQKIKVDRQEKGQKTLDSLFSPSKKGLTERRSKGARGMSRTLTRSQTWMIGKGSSSSKLFLWRCTISNNVVRNSSFVSKAIYVHY
jgi:hypothetical protein